jgi:hypothetical protein
MVQIASRSIAVWYLARLITVNATALVCSQMAPTIASQAVSSRTGSQDILVEGFECGSALALMFAPPEPGSAARPSSEVCLSHAPLADVIPSGWSAEALPAAEVFAAADPRVKRVVAVLYGGQRPLVARGWIAREDRLESVTLISPSPDPSITHLVPGTLLIRVVTTR